MVYERKGSLVVLPKWDDKMLRRTRHFCGRAHASRYVERWISTPGTAALPDAASEPVSETANETVAHGQLSAVPNLSSLSSKPSLTSMPGVSGTSGYSGIATFPQSATSWLDDEYEANAARLTVRYA
ncbi:MAG: hypothetical protein JWM43_172 [Acidobacteriaceae bacterium]|nr:hypothetical protein [Acidobacteriaceae bacterium]